MLQQFFLRSTTSNAWLAGWDMQFQGTLLKGILRCNKNWRLSSSNGGVGEWEWGVGGE